MAGANRRGSITAWLLSAGVHVVVLAVFGVVRFSQSCSDTPTGVRQDCVAQIKKTIDRPVIIPKPKIKKPAFRPGVKNTQKISETVLPRDRVRLLPTRLALPEVSGSLPVFRAGNSGSIEFFGQRTSRRKICYVVDCSGSMQGLLGRVREQLKSSITRLEPDQYFYIIFFRGKELLESGNGRLVRATVKTKSAACDFVDSVRPGGRTNAVSALKRAMQIKGPGGRSPGLIYFLTDGFDLQTDETAGFAARLETLRRQLAPATKINTIGFWPQQPDRQILESVAGNSGGEFINID